MQAQPAVPADGGLHGSNGAAGEPYVLLHESGGDVESTHLDFRVNPFQTPEDLDVFLQRVYEYYEGKGFWSIVLSKVSNLVIFGFVLFFATFLIVFVNYQTLFSPNLQHVSDAVQWNRAGAFVPFWLFASLFYAFFLYLVVLFVITFRENVEIKRFYHEHLRLPEEEIPTVEWSEVCRRLVAVPRLCVTKEAPLTALEVAMILMRRENYVIALFNRELLDVSLPLLDIKVYTKVLEWSLQVSLFNWMFAQLRSHNAMSDPQLPEMLRRRFRVFGAFFLVVSPFVAVYLLLYYFFQYGEVIRNRPGALGSRQWSRYAQWKFREFNELAHSFRHRMNQAVEPASFYVDQFQPPVLTILARLFVFIGGAVVAVLVVWGLISEELLTSALLWNRTLLFYLSLLSVVVAAGRAFIPDEHFVFQPQMYLDQVALFTHHHPKCWKNARSIAAQKLVLELFEFRLVSFLKELLGVIVSPLLLLFVLPQHAERIYAFFQEFTIYLPHGLGHCCSFAYFPDMRRFGNAKHGAPYDVPKDQRTLHGKLEKSIITFQASHPDWQPPPDAERLFVNLSSSAPTDPQDPLLQSLRVAPGTRGALHRQAAPPPGQGPLSSSLLLCDTTDPLVLHRMEANYSTSFGTRKGHFIPEQPLRPPAASPPSLPLGSRARAASLEARAKAAAAPPGPVIAVPAADDTAAYARILGGARNYHDYGGSGTAASSISGDRERELEPPASVLMGSHNV